LIARRPKRAKREALRFMALGKRLSLRPVQQRVMRKDRRLRAKRADDLDLHASIGDVVRAANDMGDPEVNIIHDAWQRIEEAAILADQHRIGKRRTIHRDMALNDIVERHLFMVELETPMRAAAFGLKGGALLIRQFQRGPVINRRQTAGELALAAAV